MNFNEYQEKAKSTAIYPKSSHCIYPALLLAGEAGEISNKVQKWIRDETMDFASTVINGEFAMNLKRRDAIADELGDILWAAAALASDLGYTLDDIAQRNVDKLADRASRGVIKGDGDRR